MNRSMFYTFTNLITHTQILSTHLEIPVYIFANLSMHLEIILHIYKSDYPHTDWDT